MSDNDCPFCTRIAAGEYDDEMSLPGETGRGVAVFEPLNPVTPGCSSLRHLFHHDARFVVDKLIQSLVQRHNDAAYAAERRAVSVFVANSVGNGCGSYPRGARGRRHQPSLTAMVRTAQWSVSIFGIQACVEQHPGRGVHSQQRTRKIGTQRHLDTTLARLIRKGTWLALEGPARSIVDGGGPDSIAALRAAPRVAVFSPASTAPAHLVTTPGIPAGQQPGRWPLDAELARFSTYGAIRSWFIGKFRHATQTTTMTIRQRPELLHAHIVPRRPDDGLALPWWSGRQKREPKS